MYDLFFISYDELNADENWENLNSRFPHAKRLHGIKGISAAHLECAKRSFTKMFWTVDGDTIVDTSWDFSFQPKSWDQKYLHLWYSRNSVNLLEYGYGSVKLWPKKRVIDFNGNWLDFTTSVGDIKLIEDTIATTIFNTSPYETWKSSFRESVKLCENIKIDSTDELSKKRLEIWSSINQNDTPFSEWASKGAVDGINFHQDNKTLSLINDFDWLKIFFTETQHIDWRF